MTIEENDALKGAAEDCEPLTQAPAVPEAETAQTQAPEDTESGGGAPIWELENRRPTPQEWVESLDAKKFRLYQILGGAVIGIAASCCLMFIPETDTFTSLNFLLAVVIALLGPRLLEKRLGQRLGVLRFAAAGALLVALLINLLNALVINPV